MAHYEYCKFKKENRKIMHLHSKYLITPAACVHIVIGLMLIAMTAIAAEVTPVFSGPEMPDILDIFTKDRAAFHRYYGRKDFKASGRLLNIFGLELLNVYSANIVTPQGDINCTPTVGPEMEHMEYLYDNYKVGQPIMVQGIINGVAFGTLMLTPCQTWILPNIDKVLPEAAKGNAEAQYQLAEIYAFGLGLPSDTKLAITWYQRAAAQGYKPATAAIKLLDTRKGIAGYKAEQDRLMALLEKEQELIATYASASIDQLYKASNAGVVEAKMNLGQRYLDGNGVTQDEVVGIEYLSQAAVHGNKRAIAALKTAATPGMFTRGSAMAAFALGNLYAKGQGVNADDAEAFTWFNLAATQNHPGAVERAKFYDDKVFAALKQTASDGDKTATVALAKRYLAAKDEVGNFTTISKAVPLLIKAAGLGDTEALMLLEKQARPGWLENGNADAAFALGEIFFKGIGRTADRQLASYWYGIAAGQGIEEAKLRIREIEQQIPSSQ